MNLETNRRFDIEARIYEKYERARESEPDHRSHLGASDIGNECPRHVWYTFRHAFKKEFDGRLLRLFNRGHREEPVIEDDLRSIEGVELQCVDDTGNQIQHHGYNGYVTVNLDGVATIPKKLPIRKFRQHETEYVIVEMKTMNLKKHKQLCQKGVKETCPDYYRQMQAQLLVANNIYDGALFIAVNKNTDDVYTEIVYPDFEEQKEIDNLIMNLIQNKVPEMLDVSPAAPPCRFCDYKQLCHDNRYDLLEKNCRTCDHSRMAWYADDPTRGGHWFCAKEHRFGEVCDDWAQHIGF